MSKGTTPTSTYIRTNEQGYDTYQYHLPNRNGVSCTTGTCVTLSSMTYDSTASMATRPWFSSSSRIVYRPTASLPNNPYNPSGSKSSSPATPQGHASPRPSRSFLCTFPYSVWHFNVPSVFSSCWPYNAKKPSTNNVGSGGNCTSEIRPPLRIDGARPPSARK